MTAIASLGPLDAFAAWLGRIPWPAGLRRIVALGSTSVITKRASSAAGERELAARLAAAESTLGDLAQRHGIALTVLRATLIYGGEADTVARIAAFARRWHLYPQLLGAAGKAMRQPVHVADIAGACMAALEAADTGLRTFDVPGGEALTLNALIARSARAACPTAWPLPIPVPLLLAAARCSGRLPLASALAVDSARRMGSDQLFDAGPASRELGHRPRRFDPSPASASPPP